VNREKVESSNIASIGYDTSTRTLEVEFKNGNVFQYEAVEPEHHIRLLNAGKPGWDKKAPSVGKYFHRYIRPKYKARKIEPEGEA